MKLIFLTSDYGGRASIAAQYSHRIYFAGAQPPLNRLVTIDLPNLSSYTYHEILSALKRDAQKMALREINEFSEHQWRESVLDDYTEAANYTETVWYIHQHFPATDFAAFGDRWLGEAQNQLKTALLTENGAPRIAAFERIKHLQERVYYVMDKTFYRLNEEIQKMHTEIDAARFDEVTARTSELEEWVRVAGGFKSQVAINSALYRISDEIKTRRLASEEIHRLLLKFGPALRQATSYPAHYFWTNIGQLLRFEQNATGQTIDLTEATEEKVQYGWHVIGAKRIGQIAANRNALVIKNKRTQVPEIYVSGERKLKFQIQKNGGSLNKFGCTLTLGNQEEASSIQPALLEVEKIDALANLDVDQALEKIAHLDLPKNHMIYAAAEKARVDFRQARVLADLLIELLVGVDADIARRLARAQSRGNRR